MRLTHLGVEHRDGDPPGPLPGNAPVASVRKMRMLGDISIKRDVNRTGEDQGRCTSRL